MGRKRKRIVRTKPIPTVPKIFDCPICGGSNSINIELDRKIRTAIILCGKCKVQATRPLRTIEEEVDIFGDWLDELMSQTEDLQKESFINDKI